MNPSADPKRAGLIRALCAVILVALTFSIYYNSLDGEFVYDDNMQIVDNPWIRSYKNLPHIFGAHSFGFSMDNKEATTYRPVVFSVFVAEYAMFGLKPWGWHLFNLLLHAANSIMVFIVFARLLDAFKENTSGADPPLLRYIPPMAGALIFTTHTLNNEVVAWVGCVPELLYTFLCLAALYLHIRSVESARVAKAAFIFLSALLFFTAMFTKETAIALPAFVYIYEAIRRRGTLLSRLTRSLPSTLPYIAALAVYIAIRMSALGGMVPRGNMYPFLNGYQYFLNGMVLFVKYMRALVVPVGLYPFQILHPVYSAADPRAFGAAIAIAVAIVLLFIFRRRLPAMSLLAAAFIVISLLPALYIPGISRHTFADRYLYFSTIGYGLIIALVLKGLAARAPKSGYGALRAAAIVVLIAAGLYSAGAIKRNATWKNDLTLWTESEKGSTENYVAKFQVGNALANTGRPVEAIAKYKEAIDIAADSSNPDPWIIGTSRMNMARLYAALGRSEEAAVQYRTIISKYPSHPDANYELGIILQAQGRCDEAITHYSRAALSFKKPSGIKDALTNMGNCYYVKGSYQDALETYEKALGYAPNDPTLLRNLRILKRRMGQ